MLALVRLDPSKQHVSGLESLGHHVSCVISLKSLLILGRLQQGSLASSTWSTTFCLAYSYASAL
jgi:hypothetical protein